MAWRGRGRRLRRSRAWKSACRGREGLRGLWIAGREGACGGTASTAAVAEARLVGHVEEEAARVDDGTIGRVPSGNRQTRGWGTLFAWWGGGPVLKSQGSAAVADGEM